MDERYGRSRSPSSRSKKGTNVSLVRVVSLTRPVARIVLPNPCHRNQRLQLQRGCIVCNGVAIFGDYRTRGGKPHQCISVRRGLNASRFRLQIVHCGVNSVPPEKFVMPASRMVVPFFSRAIAKASRSFGVVNIQRMSWLIQAPNCLFDTVILVGFRCSIHFLINLITHVGQGLQKQMPPRYCARCSIDSRPPWTRWAEH